VPTGVVEDENDAAFAPRAGACGKVGQELSKNDLLTPSDRHQTVSSLAGWTKAMTYRARSAANLLTLRSDIATTSAARPLV
jgi:hypothetical protein